MVCSACGRLDQSLRRPYRPRRYSGSAIKATLRPADAALKRRSVQATRNHRSPRSVCYSSIIYQSHMHCICADNDTWLEMCRLLRIRLMPAGIPLCFPRNPLQGYEQDRPSAASAVSSPSLCSSINGRKRNDHGKSNTPPRSFPAAYLRSTHLARLLTISINSSTTYEVPFVHNCPALSPSAWARTG